MQKDRIALQLYSVREDMQADFYGTLKKVKELGYAGVEFAGLFGKDPLEVNWMCRELGLVPVSAHVPMADMLSDADKTVETYQQLGCKHVVLPYLTPEYRPGTPGFETVITTLKRLGEKLNARDMILQYHNHDFEFVKENGEYALDRIYREVGPELLQTQLDTCWVNVGGEDPVAYIHKYAGRMPTVHLKDFAGVRSENMYALIGIDEDKKQAATGAFEFRPLGYGLQDIPAIVRAATACGAEWFIVEQDQPSMGLTPMECAEASVKYLLGL